MQIYLQCDLGSDSFFLRHLPGAASCILGIISQLFIGRRLGIKGRFNYIAAILPVIVSLSTDDRLRFIWPHFVSRDLAGAGVLLWWWLMMAIAVALFLRNRIPQKFQSERRAFLTASTAALCAAPAAVLGAGVIFRKDFHINEIDIPVPNLPKDLQGLRLLQLSDIHIGEFFSEQDVARVVDASNGLRADLVFITGDLITTKWDPLDRCLLQLARLRSASGLWGCLGNHELYSKVQNYTTAKARELGIRFLRHEAVPLQFGGARINLVGVDYPKHGERYLAGVEQLVSGDSFNLLLSHTPDVFPVAAKQGFDLTLSGHTHGGQINLELFGKNYNLVDLDTPYTRGLYNLGSSRIYVNSGLGTIGVPIRLGAPPEISVIRLCNT
jgi:uncharacterized protein